jgi:hypothetical protein
MTARPDKSPHLLIFGVGGTVHDTRFLGLEGTTAGFTQRFHCARNDWLWEGYIGFLDCVVQRFLASATDAAEAEGCRENGATALARLHSSSNEASAVAYALDVI